MGKQQELTAQKWNQEYLTGKYEDEAPIPFVSDILATLKDNKKLNGNGLYVGCGNGRNYIPLVGAGLNLTGLDISPEALNQIKAKHPNNSNNLVCADFLDYQAPSTLDYIASIQVFQHGAQEEVTKYFEKTAQLLKTGGLFFLRVNSAATQIFHKNKTIEVGLKGGKTIEYTDGPKAGLNIHFYTKEELEYLTMGLFRPVTKPTEVIMVRKPPKSGQWAQWEGIWRKDI